jgi:putative endonuclease
MGGANRRAQGALFEDLACAYLKRKGYRIVERNVCLLKKEVDIIAVDGDTVVFVEVKGRLSGRFGSPLEAVSSLKQVNLTRAARAYLSRRNLLPRDCRFDVIGFRADAGSIELEHIENAFGV